MNDLTSFESSGQGAIAVASRPRVPVLVVDDNSAKRLALQAVLKPLGHSLVEAGSGKAALRCVMAEDFAVILLDVCMPIMDGFETASLIRQRRQSEMTPIIFITAFGGDEILQTDHYAEGAADFIYAPVDPSALRAKVSVFAKLYLNALDLATQAQAVQARADQLRILTDAAPIGIFQTDAENRYVYTNPRWSAITGISPEEAVGRAWDSIVNAEQPAGVMAELADGAIKQAEFCHRFEISSTGSDARIVQVTSVPVADSDDWPGGWVGTVADVTAEVGTEAAMSKALNDATSASQLESDSLASMNHELTALARGDALTGLGNRRALQEDLDLLEARVARYGHRYCVALIDVDHFKSYNDTYGHLAGDHVLQAVAAQLKDHVRGGDSVYRYGGDEFLCIFPEQSLASGIIAVQRMQVGLARLAMPHGDNSTSVLTFSAGLAVLDPGDTREAVEVLKEADESLYQAKQLGRNRVEYVRTKPASVDVRDSISEL